MFQMAIKSIFLLSSLYVMYVGVNLAVLALASTERRKKKSLTHFFQLATVI